MVQTRCRYIREGGWVRLEYSSSISGKRAMDLGAPVDSDRVFSPPRHPPLLGNQRANSGREQVSGGSEGDRTQGHGAAATAVVGARRQIGRVAQAAIQGGDQRTRRVPADSGPGRVAAPSAAPAVRDAGRPQAGHDREQAPRRVRVADRGRGQRHEHDLPAEAEHQRTGREGAVVRVLGQRVPVASGAISTADRRTASPVRPDDGRRHGQRGSRTVSANTTPHPFSAPTSSSSPLSDTSFQKKKSTVYGFSFCTRFQGFYGKYFYAFTVRQPIIG